MKRVCIITGSRAEYGILRVLMEKICEDDELDLSIIATGMHLSPIHGYTVKHIKDDGFNVDFEIDMLLCGDTLSSLVKSLGLGIIGISQALENIQPDLTIIFGDRVEALAGAISSSYMRILTAHIHGGDHAAGYHIDDYNRMAITKFSHIHFVAIEEHARKLISLGENPERIYVVGSLSLDEVIERKNKFNERVRERITKKYDIKEDEPLILVIQHPVSSELNQADFQMKTTMDAIKELELQTIVIYPNIDPGGQKMINVIKKYEKYPFIKAYPNIPREDFIDLMIISSVMVGNSSCGIIEAPSLGLPFVNIGTRQKNRVKAENVIDVNYDKESIKSAILTALYDDEFRRKVRKCRNPYGDGKTSDRIIDIIKKIEPDERFFIKF